MCIDPKCTYTVPGRGYLLGKEARCPECNRVFVIDNDVLRRVLLRCQRCIGTSDKIGPDTPPDIEVRLKAALMHDVLNDTERENL